MADPTVCCILLTKDRPEMARQAVECFRAQAYPGACLQIYDTSESGSLCGLGGGAFISAVHCGADRVLTIGSLRNRVLSIPWVRKADVIVHWDDDDWSHPSRISEQVALLQASGADCVGYREVLFWRTRRVGPVDVDPMERTMPVQDVGEAYLYTNNDPRYLIGSSMCYWRKAWEARPFEDVNREEDGRWIKGVKSVGVSSFLAATNAANLLKGCDPRMICRIHAGNARHYPVDELVGASPNWRRVPEWDAHCREVMG